MCEDLKLMSPSVFADGLKYDARSKTYRATDLANVLAFADRGQPPSELRRDNVVARLQSQPPFQPPPGARLLREWKNVKVNVVISKQQLESDHGADGRIGAELALLERSYLR